MNNIPSAVGNAAPLMIQQLEQMIAHS